MLRRFRADLHVHTCLSPCGDLFMSPRKIASRAESLRIALLAVCDHNSAGNALAVMRAAGTNVTVLPGLEICTREEIHVLALFGEIEAARAMQEKVQRHLEGTNDPEAFGLQILANELDEVMGYEDRLLIGATGLAIEEVVDAIHRLDGLAIAAHVDRESYSVISQLGFIPENVRFDALELSRSVTAKEFRRTRSAPVGCPFIRNSDAHYLDDVGTNTGEYELDRPSFRELRKALRAEDGRHFCDA